MENHSVYVRRERKRARKDGPKTDTPGKGKSKASTDGTTTIASFNDPNADLVLVSADEKPFRVHKYYLQAHSSVFRDMIGDAVLSTTASTDKTTTISLSDPEIETAQVLSLFLSTLCAPTGNAFRLELERTGFGADTLVDKAVKLVVKYDCPLLLREMLKAVRLCPVSVASLTFRLRALPQREEDLNILRAFTIAAENGVVDECAALIALGRPGRYMNSTSEEDSCPLDPGQVSLTQARKIPFEYYWALQVAWAGSARDPPSQGRLEARGTRPQRAAQAFVALVAAAKEGTEEAEKLVAEALHREREWGPAIGVLRAAGRAPYDEMGEDDMDEDEWGSWDGEHAVHPF